MTGTQESARKRRFATIPCLRRMTGYRSAVLHPGAGATARRWTSDEDAVSPTIAINGVKVSCDTRAGEASLETVDPRLFGPGREGPP